MSFEYIIFDLDGTLTEPEEGITRSIEYALNKMGILVDSRKSLVKYIGPPLIPAFCEDFGMTEGEAKQALYYYRERFILKGMYENSVYDGIKELLAALKKEGRKLLLATTKPKSQAMAILDYFSLTEYFDITEGASEDGKIVEKADVIKVALSAIPEIDIKKTVMIGDRKYDIHGAKSHNIKSVGVLYGYGDKEELERAGADYIVKSVDELYKLLIL